MDEQQDGGLVFDDEIGPFIGDRKPAPERARRPLRTRPPIGGGRRTIRDLASPPIAGSSPGSLGENLKKFWGDLKNGERYALVAGSIGAGILLLASSGKGEGAKLRKV